MDEKTSKIIKDRFAQIPQELRDALTAADLPLKMKTISTTHGLMIDQLEGLQNEILFILLGILPSSSFVDNLSREIGVSKEKAFAIAEDTNKLIFNAIREHLMKWEASMQEEGIDETEETQEAQKPQEVTELGIQNTTPVQQRESAVSSLEKIGGFSIEKNEGTINNENTTMSNETPNDVSASDREAIITSIENPTPSASISSPKINVAGTTEKHVDPLIDHLLTTSIVMPQQKIKTSIPQTPSKIPVPQKPNRTDMYREPIE